MTKNIDPMQLAGLLWPQYHFYDKEREIIYSVEDNAETYVPAGNQLGKDFTAGFVAVWFLLTRQPCRIVTTSAKDKHLIVLWSEINNFIETSKINLRWKFGGPLVVNHYDIRKVVNTRRDPKSYCIGMVANQDSIASMQGHHIASTDGVPRTLFICDEASSVMDEYYRMASTWADRILILGNPWPCDNFFRKAVREGDKLSDDGRSYYRKIIKIRAFDSPNIRLAKTEIEAGREPSGKIIVPGVKTWSTYKKNLALWDKVQQTVSLDGEFYEGAELLLFPPDWLARAGRLGHAGAGRFNRRAKAVGIDPAEGGDKTSMAAVDEFGLIELSSRQTPDTADVVDEAKAFCLRHGIGPEQSDKLMFDRGGGGKQHADRLRRDGWKHVRTVAFGESLIPDPSRVVPQLPVRKEQREERYVYFNRRAQLYGELSKLCDPSLNPEGFAIPAEYENLRVELAPVPKGYDGEGRLKLPSKNKTSENSTVKTLIELIGHSPDEADALAVAVHCMLWKPVKSVIKVT